jgi:hypothetical protein
MNPELSEYEAGILPIDHDIRSPGVRLIEGEVYNSHPPSAEVKNEGSYTFTPPYAF